MKNRHGSYKKILMAEAQLAPSREKLAHGIASMQGSQLSPFLFCTLYILLFLRIRHPKNWLQPRGGWIHSEPMIPLTEIIPEEFQLSEWEKHRLSEMSALDLFQNYNLKGIPYAVNRAMANWGNGLWSIILLTHIPTPRELLSMQVRNSRCVTTLVDPTEIDKLVLSSRDPLSFVLHDLHHADQFFSNTKSLKGQLGFYSLVEKIYDKSLIKQSLKEDERFRSEFNYVVSDMNAYVIHLLKCFKSAVVRAGEKGAKNYLFQQILDWWEMPENVIISAMRLNTPDFKNEDEISLVNFFENSQEIIT